MSKQTVKPKDAKGRRRIQEILKTEGPQEAAALAEKLGVSAMAVRQHLYAMQDEKLVTFVEEPRPKGRPAKLWQLTGEANKFFPDAHAELTISLIDVMKETFGDEGLDRFLDARAAKQSADYQRRMEDVGSLRDRLIKLAEIREKEGYMACVTEDEDGLLFVENHCPICVAAHACSGLCAMELQVFQSVLGEDVEVSRTDHILAGARRCAYRVRPKT